MTQLIAREISGLQCWKYDIITSWHNYDYPFVYINPLNVGRSARFHAMRSPILIARRNSIVPLYLG